MEAEVDRDRTRLEAFGELVFESAGIVGLSAEKLAPVRELLDSISRVVWGVREEAPKQLPRQEERKRIGTSQTDEPKDPNNVFRRDTDDEVPF